jgi:hypothetical protein
MSESVTSSGATKGKYIDILSTMIEGMEYISFTTADNEIKITWKRMRKISLVYLVCYFRI